MPVAHWAAPDAVLLLWATDPLLPRALEVIEAWGFTYKTVGFYWVKLNKSAATRLSRDGRCSASATSSPAWASGRAPTRSPACSRPAATPSGSAGDVPKLLIAPRREHSRKPDETYERIERLLPGPLSRAVRAGHAAGLGRLGDRRPCSTGPGAHAAAAVDGAAPPPAD